MRRRNITRRASSSSSIPAATTTSLPLDPLRKFIDTAAEVQRAMGFQNEKDHPEVAPSQFEINYGYGEVVAAADQIQLYKLLCRQIANNMGYTASFLPKPVVGVNGSGMHTNVSVSEGKTNLFWDEKGQEKLSQFGWEFIDRILTHALDFCLILNPSVNAYRRLDPHFEAPNQIQGFGDGSRFDGAGADRQLAVDARRSARRSRRTPIPTWRCIRIFKTGVDGTIAKVDNLRAGRALPARQHPEGDRRLQGVEVDRRDSRAPMCRVAIADLKQASANRCAARTGHVREGLRGAVSTTRSTTSLFGTISRVTLSNQVSVRGASERSLVASAKR